MSQHTTQRFDVQYQSLVSLHCAISDAAKQEEGSVKLTKLYLHNRHTIDNVAYFKTHYLSHYLAANSIGETRYGYGEGHSI